MQKKAIDDIASNQLNQARLQPHRVVNVGADKMEIILKTPPKTNTDSIKQRIPDLTVKLASEGLGCGCVLRSADNPTQSKLGVVKCLIS